MQLPWSTANEDLVELFETTGQVELAEILFDGTRSKGAGVVQFAQVAEAETAIGASSLSISLISSFSFCACNDPRIQLSSSNTCMAGDRLMYVSMIAGTRLRPRPPREGKQCQCSQMGCE
jgi:RNA recognition motif. (a.k.a. RRM, RBD, or RNP domain)